LQVQEFELKCVCQLESVLLYSEMVFTDCFILQGGTLVEYDGKLRLLEIAQVPKDYVSHVSF